jgi:putative hydrolase of the HAD superfamily
LDVQTIVFDFGNVIGYFDHRRAARLLTAHCSLPEEVILGHVCDAEREDAYEAGRLTSAEFLAQLRAALRAGCPDEHLGAAYADIFSPNEDVCALVPRLRRRYRLLLGSNTTELHARQFRRQFADTLRHFDALVFSYEVGARKPKAAFFEHCQRRAGCAADQCLFIDDLPANVAGARECGWRGIVYRDAAGLRRDLAALGIRTDAD